MEQSEESGSRLVLKRARVTWRELVLQHQFERCPRWWHHPLLTQ